MQTAKGPELKFIVCEPDTPRLAMVGPVRARGLADQECKFATEKITKEGPTVSPCLPPDWLGGQIVARPKFENIPVITALAQAPTLRHDGEIIWEQGYDISTGIYLTSDLRVGVPEFPTQVDAADALAQLLDLVCDFDFANAGGSSVWIAGLLSIVARHTFSGPVPMFIIDASKRGSGKTTLADLAAIIGIGVKACRMFYTDDDVEMDKRITALALAGEQFALIDNVVGKLASPPLDAALTSESYRGRVLGKSEMTAAMPMKIVWFVTGNGLIIGADLARRSLLARLEPSTDHPEDRTGPKPGQLWKYRDLVGHVRANRARYLGYALTIVRAYILAGRPDMGFKTPMGSFEAWSDTIRSAIVFAGGVDPCITIDDTRKADLEDYAFRTMVECWPVEDDVVVTASTLIEWATLDPPLSDTTKRELFERTRTIREQWRAALLEWLPARKGDLPTARELGYALRAMKGSIVKDYKIEAGEHTKSGIPWKRVRVSGTPPAKPNGETLQAPPSLFSIIR